MWRQLPGDAPVGGHDENGGHVALQGAVEEGETLNVQHVHLIHKQHLEARHSVSFKLYSQFDETFFFYIVHICYCYSLKFDFCFLQHVSLLYCLYV